jgi:hypothetical protein
MLIVMEKEISAPAIRGEDPLLRARVFAPVQIV